MKTIKKRIIFSRHGLRYPLFYKDDLIKTYGKDIVNWDFHDKLMGHLSKKGAIIEYLFGQELAEILGIENNKEMRVLCNSTHRTYHTARLLTLGMTPFKEQIINYKDKEFKTLDTRYNILFHKDELLDHEKVKKLDKKLEKVYIRIEELLDLKKGTITDKKTTIKLDEKGYLNVKGALRMATDIADMFVLKYYENFPEKEIFDSPNFMEDLRLISTAKDEFLDLIFGDVRYIKESKENPYLLLKEELKTDNDLTLIVGHDSNLSCLINMLGIDYKLNENMIEKYPIGAKLLFEVYDDNSYDLSYIYYHYDDIRNIKYAKPIIEKIHSGKFKTQKQRYGMCCF